MKISNHPSLYTKYKDKRVQFYGIKGIIVGYLIPNLKYVILILEANIENESGSIIDFANHSGFVLKDYHGDTENGFFFVNKNDFDKGFAIEI